jgi:hypothetical protein
MKSLKIEFKRTDAQLALCKKLGSKNKTESFAAAEAIAEVLSRPILQVIEQAPVISNLFSTITYDEGTPASIPLDPFFDIRQRGYINVWNQAQPGGAATNFIQGNSELIVQTFPIESAISLNKNLLRATRLDYLASAMTRIVQEVLLTQEINAANILMASVPAARIDGNNANNAVQNIPVGRSASAGIFQLDDLNTIIVGYDRVVASWVGGTPVNMQRAVTDLLGSPEWMGQVRAIAYQPSNTRQGSVLTQGGSSIAAPEAVRNDIFRAGGIPTLYDINLHKIYELGVGRTYTQLFGSYAGSQNFYGNGQVTSLSSVGAAPFNNATEQIVVGLNSEMFDLARVRENSANGEFNLVAEDLPIRTDKVGWFGGLKEGYVSVDGRAKYSLIY